MSGYAVARQNGWMSANDIRELENLDQIPENEGGNLYLVNGNMIQIKAAIKKQEGTDEKVLEMEKQDIKK